MRARPVVRTRNGRTNADDREGTARITRMTALAQLPPCSRSQATRGSIILTKIHYPMLDQPKDTPRARLKQ